MIMAPDFGAVLGLSSVLERRALRVWCMLKMLIMSADVLSMTK
jgi:hypothetical protein